MENQFDGELFIGDNIGPELSSFENLNEEKPNVFELLEFTNEERHVVIDKVLFKYKDLTSLPKTKNKCGKWFKPWGGAKICVGWTLKKKWLYRIGHLRVTLIDENDGKRIVEECLKTGAITGILAGVFSGGSAALGAAKIAIEACLAAKLGDKLISVSLDVKSHRGDWE